MHYFHGRWKVKPHTSIIRASKFDEIVAIEALASISLHLCVYICIYEAWKSQLNNSKQYRSLKYSYNNRVKNIRES